MTWDASEGFQGWDGLLAQLLLSQRLRCSPSVVEHARLWLRKLASLITSNARSRTTHTKRILHRMQRQRRRSGECLLSIHVALHGTNSL